MGVSVRETSSEASTPTLTTTAKASNMRATMPSMKITGAKMLTRVSVAATTAIVTSRAPSMVALSRSAPVRSPWRNMLSSTTIASSTTTPISNSRPSSVMVLKV